MKKKLSLSFEKNCVVAENIPYEKCRRCENLIGYGIIGEYPIPESVLLGAVITVKDNSKCQSCFEAKIRKTL